mmetsp:Transcript_34799/g.110504  ORF Transcript_34799/g.110504 Transcript_34799/m.110504 type:complete len:400 (+) Transcript_34799:782-1981(+)
MRARQVLDLPPALPSAESNLHLLTAVEPHLRVVAAKVQEVGAVGREEAAGHHWRTRRLVVIGAREGSLAQAPREAQHTQAAGFVLEVVVIDGVDARHDHAPAILGDPREEGLQPTGRGFDVAVQEDGDLCRRTPNALHASNHQAPPFLEPRQPELRQRADVPLQLLLQARPVPLIEALLVRGAGIVDQDDLLEQLWRRVVQDAVYGPHQRHEVLVVENDDDTGLREVARVLLVLEPATLRAEVLLGPVHAQRLADAAVEAETPMRITLVLVGHLLRQRHRPNPATRPVRQEAKQAVQVLGVRPRQHIWGVRPDLHLAFSRRRSGRVVLQLKRGLHLDARCRIARWSTALIGGSRGLVLIVRRRRDDALLAPATRTRLRELALGSAHARPRAPKLLLIDT